MKQPGSFDTIVNSFRQLLESLPDKRTDKNTQYGMEDAALSAGERFLHSNSIVPGFSTHDGEE